MSNNIGTIYEKVKETGKHGLIYGLSSTLTTVIAIILVPLYTRYIDPADYGMLALVIITISIFTNIFSFGLKKAFFRFYFDKNEKNKEVITTAFSLITQFSMALILISSILSPLLSYLIIGKVEYFYIFILLAIEGGTLNISHVGLSFLRTKRQSKLYSKIFISNFIIKLLLIIVLILVFNLGILGIVLGRVISGFILLLIIISQNWKYFKIKFNRDLSMRMLKFGTPFIFSQISVFILTWFDRYFINFFKGLTEVGIYNVGYQMGAIIIVLLITPFNFIWGALKLEVMDHDNSRKYYNKILIYFSIVSFFLFLSMSLLNYEPIKLIVDSRYWDCYLVIPLVTLGYVFNGISTVMSIGIEIKKKTQYILIINGSAAILNIILNLIFIPHYGMIGAAYATFISFSIGFVLSYYINYKLYPINYQWEKVFKVILITGILFIIGWFLPLYELMEYIGFERYGIISSVLVFSIKGLIVLSFPVIIWHSNVFEDDDRGGVRKLFTETKAFFLKRD